MRYAGVPLALVAAPLAAQEADLDALSRDPANWIMPAKNYAGTRYSELDQINAENVGELEVAWMFSLGKARGRRRRPSSSTARCTSSGRTRTTSSRSTRRTAR